MTTSMLKAKMEERKLLTFCIQRSAIILDTLIPTVTSRIGALLCMLYSIYKD